jgi:hypothetical protein
LRLKLLSNLKILIIISNWYGKALIHCLMEKPKLKKSKTLSINIHEIESNDFSKSTRRRIPGRNVLRCNNAPIFKSTYTKKESANRSC